MYYSNLVRDFHPQQVKHHHEVQHHRRQSTSSKVYNYSRFGIDKINSNDKEICKDIAKDIGGNRVTIVNENVALINQIAKSSAVMLHSSIRIRQGRIFELGLSFLALILLTGKLYDVDREVSFLKFVSSEWLPNASHVYNVSQSKKQIQTAIFHIENLRHDIDLLIVELWSARTTLILSVVFVLVYIFSWGWMAYAVRETKTTKDVSLKTVLLLAVFAAVDIAASAGFVMVRVIMYAMRDNYFPKDMRPPTVTTEHDQMVAFAALRFASLKSSSGTIDLYVSVIVGFLTALRVYSVVCAVSFYRRARKDSSGGTDYAPSDQTSKALDDFLKQSASYLQTKVRPLSTGYKDHRFSVTGTSETCEDESSEGELKIQAADMPMHMQKAAIQSASQAIKLYNTEKHIAESVKQDFDQLFQPTWHCIVGRNWGSCVTHSKQCYIRLLYKEMTILLYKST